MKPEIRIALVREVERSKFMMANEYASGWIRLGYVGAIVTTLFGVSLMTSAVSLIAGHPEIAANKFLGSLLILLAIIVIAAPWYFLIRFYINRKVRMLSEAILSVGQFDGFITG